MNRSVTLRSILLSLTAFLLFIVYSGCGSSEESMTDDTMATDTGEYQSDNGGYQTDNSNGNQSDTDSYQSGSNEYQSGYVAPDSMGEMTQQEASQPVETQQPMYQPAATVQEGPTVGQMQNELDSLKTENIQLQDKLSTSEKNNQDLMAKISDLEAANMAMKKKMEEQKTKTPTMAKTAPAPVEKSSPEEIKAYKGAVSMFDSKDYAGAVNELQSLLKNGVKKDYADNCHYWLGLSYFQMKDYTKALGEFQQAQQYKFSEKGDDAQMMIARTYARMGNREKAVMEYKKLVDMYPTSEYVARAKARLQ